MLLYRVTLEYKDFSAHAAWDGTTPVPKPIQKVCLVALYGGGPGDPATYAGAVLLALEWKIGGTRTDWDKFEAFVVSVEFVDDIAVGGE